MEPALIFSVVPLFRSAKVTHMLPGLTFMFIAWLGVFFLSPAAARRCRRWGIVAGLDSRRAHTTPTPHGAGLILPIVVLPLLLAATALGWLPHPAFMLMLATGSFAVAWVGWLDDRHELTARARLAVHLLAVTGGVLLLPPLFDIVPLWLEKSILILAWGWYVNLFNFMDGADGQATMQATLVSLGLALLVPPLAPAALLVTGACIGFFRVNFPPAKAFLGDVGSTWLGYMLGGLLFLGLVDDTWKFIYPLATLTLFFSLDATTTLLSRLSRGHHPLTPHKEFWFHKALATGLTHTRLLAFTTLLTTGLLTLALLGHTNNLGLFTLFMGAAWVGMGACVVTLCQRRP